MVKLDRRGALAVLFAVSACTSATSGVGISHSTASSAAAASSSSSRPASSSSSLPTPSSSSSASHPAVTPHAAARTSPPPNIAGEPVVVLNPGHNGGNATHTAEINQLVYAGFGREKPCDTTGTTTDAGYSEHAFNWDVSLRVAAILRAHGVRVVFTRTSDTGVGPCVNARAAIGNHPWVAAVVSIHADGAPSSGHGFHVNLDSQRPEGATATTVAASRRLAQAIHAALVSSSGLVPSTYIGSDGYYYRSDLAGLNLAARPATFLELGNMRNAGDAALQSSVDGRARIARAIAEGILTYLRG